MDIPAKNTDPPPNVVPAYSIKYGDIWKARCPKCSWTSKRLPFPTREEAEHALKLHEVLCKGK
jgi:hypothetical protein